MAYKTVDLRGKIPGNPRAQQGAQKKTDGVVIHYNGPATGVPSGRVSPVALLSADASYHMRMGLFAPGVACNGIQYHHAVWEDTVYVLRNPDAILWHCAKWPHNGSATAINVPIGEGERATARTLQTLREFCDDEMRRQGYNARVMKGHKELSSTSCPGSLMADFVAPYRAEKMAPKTSPVKPTSGTLHLVKVPTQQVGAFKNAQGAGHLGASFEALGLKALIVVEGGWSKVRLVAQQQGAYAEKDYADAATLRLEKLGAKVERSTKATATPTLPPAAKKPAPAKRSLVPPGHRDVAANPNGTWMQRHPTRYKWTPPLEELIRELYRRFPGILVSSYVDHPEGWGRKLGKNLDVRSLDVWDDGGRGVPIDPATGTKIVNFLMNEPSPNMIDWIIWQGRIWTRARGYWVPFEDDGTGSHHDHPHVSYV